MPANAVLELLPVLWSAYVAFMYLFYDFATFRASDEFEPLKPIQKTRPRRSLRQRWQTSQLPVIHRYQYVAPNVSVQSLFGAYVVNYAYK
jgi:hypothetical protein